MNRIKTYFNPTSNSQTSSYQLQQGLIAIGSGGIFGRGLGQSVQKFNYLPEPQRRLHLCRDRGGIRLHRQRLAGGAVCLPGHSRLQDRHAITRHVRAIFGGRHHHSAGGTIISQHGLLGRPFPSDRCPARIHQPRRHLAPHRPLRLRHRPECFKISEEKV